MQVILEALLRHLFNESVNGADLEELPHRMPSSPLLGASLSTPHLFSLYTIFSSYRRAYEITYFLKRERNKCLLLEVVDT
jgi:hypothetical protein